MEKYKPHLIKPNRDTGSPCYFDELRQGYQLIDRYRKTLANAESAPCTTPGGTMRMVSRTISWKTLRRGMMLRR